MDAATWFGPVKLAHMGLVAISVLLFVARGLAVLFMPRTSARPIWAMRPGARFASVLIDTGLLATGATLWAWLGLHPVQQPWLGTKLALLLVYVVLGSFALKRAHTQRARWGFFLAALACVGFMVSIAVAHHPWGLFAGS